MTAHLRSALVATLAGIACTPAESVDREAAVAVLDVPAVRVDTAGTAGLYRAAGTVRSARRAELSTRLVGRVESVRVRAGDRVRAGQLLITVERASLSAAERQAAAALELATANLQRVERLYADSAAPLVQLEAARNTLAQAEGQARAVHADLSYADLRAPFDGTVASRLVDPGDNASPGLPLLVIEDRGAREIVVTVPDELRGWLQPGRDLAVEIGAGRRRITARILAVVIGADPRSPTVSFGCPDQPISHPASPPSPRSRWRNTACSWYLPAHWSSGDNSTAFSFSRPTRHSACVGSASAAPGATPSRW